MEIPKSPTLAELPAVARVEGEAPEVGQLVERAKAGDPSAFDGLMLLYERRIIAIGVQMGLSRDDALDACQDTFVKVFRYIGGFRSGESFFKWLYRIAVHAVYDHLKRSRPAGMISLEEIDPARAGSLKDSGPSPDATAAGSDLRKKLLAGLDTLSRQERIVFVLRDLQEIDSGEIARILRLSQVTVRRHCMTARQKLRRRLFPKDH
jgi:RNA polymerase sigma-70 factor, ECF subfamily